MASETASLSPMSIAGSLSRGTAYIGNTLSRYTLGPGVAVAKPVIQALFSAIKTGALLVVDETTGQCDEYGAAEQPPSTAPHAKLVVKSAAFWWRLFLRGDMGFAESYMLGEVECADLTQFFHLFIRNRDRLGNGTTWSSMVIGAVAGLARSTNTMSNALLNTSAHYDISNDMFAAFLSPDMTYSCPIWAPAHGSKVAETLHDAQMTKLQRFIDGARIKATDHVLEIGTGWGSFAIEAVRQTGCRVTTLTLSREQKVLAEQRIAAAGCADRIDVRLQDYRAIEVPAAPYDKIVSIEMLEAVGREYLGTYFACIDRLLKKDGGIAMFQCITMPEGRHKAYSRTKE